MAIDTALTKFPAQMLTIAILAATKEPREAPVKNTKCKITESSLALKNFFFKFSGHF